MTNIIGLTTPTGSKIMVNADQIVYFEPFHGDDTKSVIYLADTNYFVVQHTIYDICDRIDVTEGDFT